jgi:hypothetical protein
MIIRIDRHFGGLAAGNGVQHRHLSRRVPDRRVPGKAAVVKKFLALAVAAFVIFFVAYQPTTAARVVKSIGGVLGDVANGFATFLSNLV